MNDSLSQGLILAIDTETTGVDVNVDDIVELGGAYIHKGLRYGRSLRCLVNPNRFIPVAASNVHGIYNEDVEHAPVWPVVANWFKRHLDQAKPYLCGYNILSFDAPLINAQNKKHKVQWRLELDEILDPFIFCRWHHPELQSTLSNMCKVYGIHLPEDRAHRADADSIVTGLLLVAMVWAGYIPDSYQEAMTQQQRFKEQLEADTQRWGRGVYVNRTDPSLLHIARGIHRGRSILELDPSYIKRITTEWGPKDLSDEGRQFIRERTERQSSLF